MNTPEQVEERSVGVERTTPLPPGTRYQGSCPCSTSYHILRK